MSKPVARLEFEVDGSLWHDWMPYDVYPTNELRYAALERARRFVSRVSKLLKGADNFTLLRDVYENKWLVSHSLIVDTEYGSNGTVGTANYRHIAEQFPDAPSFNSGYARVPFIPLTADTIELLNSLEDYCVLCDDCLSAYEWELQSEYIADEVPGIVGSLLNDMPVGDPRLQNACLFDVLDAIDNPNEETLGDMWDSLPTDQQNELIQDALSATDAYPEIECSSAWMPDALRTKLTNHIAAILPTIDLSATVESSEQLPLWTAA